MYFYSIIKAINKSLPIKNQVPCAINLSDFYNRKSSVYVTQKTVNFYSIAIYDSLIIKNYN